MKRLLVTLLLISFLNIGIFGQAARRRPLSNPAIGDFVTDTFTQGSDANLSAHTGELGATWTLHPAAAYSGSVITNDATLDRIYTTTGTAAYYASGTPPSANYCAQADIYNVTTLSLNVAIAVRMDTSADSMILVRLNNGIQWELIERNAGANTALTNSGASLPTAGGAPVNLKLCTAGTAITVFLNGVQETGMNSTATISAAGKAGVRFSGVSSSSTGYHVDNFSAR